MWSEARQDGSHGLAQQRRDRRSVYTCDGASRAHSATARSRCVVPGVETLLFELAFVDGRAFGMTALHVLHVRVVIRCTDDTAEDRGNTRQRGTVCGRKHGGA